MWFGGFGASWDQQLHRATCRSSEQRTLIERAPYECVVNPPCGPVPIRQARQTTFLLSRRSAPLLTRRCPVRLVGVLMAFKGEHEICSFSMSAAARPLVTRVQFFL